MTYNKIICTKCGSEITGRIKQLTNTTCFNCKKKRQLEWIQGRKLQVIKNKTMDEQTNTPQEEKDKEVPESAATEEPKEEII